MLAGQTDAFKHLIETLTTDQQIQAALLFAGTLDSDAEFKFKRLLIEKQKTFSGQPAEK